MTQIFNRWLRKYLSDPQAVILGLLLLLGFVVVFYLGDMLAPLLASMVIAYLLESLVGLLTRRGVPRLAAVLVVFALFMTLLLFLLFGLVPLLSKQISQLVQELPNMIAAGQRTLLLLPERYPHFITEEQIREIMAALRVGLTTLGQTVLSVSLASISQLFTLTIYVVLMPVLVFFFLKDKEKLHDWVARYLPEDRGVATQVWHEMDLQIGNYIRGKFVEIVVVGAASFVVFAFMGLKYAMLLGALVGLSVIIPYVGAVAVTFPVVLIAYFQWGWSSEFAYLVIAYLVVQLLDGNLLVPLLFSEAVNLHPIAIITAVLLFGGLWGFWGVFFAIPLATLVKAVVHAWPRSTPESVVAEGEEPATRPAPEREASEGR
ncbi:MAG: AI-2E family transporter [Deferrisomatales bacterium]